MSNLKKEFKKVLDEEVEIAISDEQIDYMFSWFLSRLKEEATALKKESLDKDDPDNYEACFAIHGFNDALSQLLKRMGVNE